MIAGIKINVTTSWESDRWASQTIFAHIVIWLDISGTGSQINAQISKALQSNEWMTVDVSDAEPAEYDALFRAATYARSLANARRSTWFDEDSFEQYLSDFSEMVRLLKSDSRAIGSVDVSWSGRVLEYQKLLKEYEQRTNRKRPVRRFSHDPPQ